MFNFEIRTWSKRDSKMLYGREAFCSRQFTPNYSHLESEVEVMLFSGVKDDEDNKIFQGDIVQISFTGDGKTTTSISEVWYDEKKGYLCTNSYPHGECYVGQITADSRDKIKVLGNIFEHPELIKKLQEEDDENYWSRITLRS